MTSTNTANARVGNGEFVYIEVCVTRTGQPVTGLTKQQATFKALLVGPGGSDMEWNPNPHGYWENHPGYYLFEVIPMNNGTRSRARGRSRSKSTPAPITDGRWRRSRSFLEPRDS